MLQTLDAGYVYLGPIAVFTLPSQSTTTDFFCLCVNTQRLSCEICQLRDCFQGILHFTELKVSNRFIFSLFILGSCTPYNLLICYQRKHTKLDRFFSFFEKRCHVRHVMLSTRGLSICSEFQFPVQSFTFAQMMGQLKRPKRQLLNLITASN